MKILRHVAAMAVAAFLASCGGESVRGDVLITADRLFDGHVFHEPGAILVRGGTIAAVGGSIEAEAQRTIALGGATILPGFIDLHVHAQRGLLRGGVTTVRDLGAPLGALRPAGRHRGLRVLMAGPLVSVRGGYPETVWGPALAVNVRSPEEARQAVRRLARRGAAVIKISLEPGSGAWPMLPVAEVRALVVEAHAQDLEVTAHATGPEGVRRALAGGVGELAHAPCGAYGRTPAGARGERGGGRRHTARPAALQGRLRVHCRAPGRARRPALYGTDVGNTGIPFGIDVEELRLLRHAGMTPAEVLASATSRAGEQIGLAPLGRLVEGAPADVIAILGDLASPLVVVSGGQVVVAPE